MGARGKLPQYGPKVKVRFRKDAETQIRILAALWNVTIQEVIRILTAEALVSRAETEGHTMSRQINTDEPMTPEDEQYLAARGRTVDQEAHNQYMADRIAESVAHDEERFGERDAFILRNGGRI